MGASGKVVVGLVVEGADNSSSGLRGGMGSCRHMAVGRCGSNRSISSRRDNNRSSSSSSNRISSITSGNSSSNRISNNMFIDSSSSSSNRISSNTFGNSSSYYSLTIPLIMHRPNGGSGGHLIVVLTLLSGTKRNRHPRLTLRWAACTSASGAEDSGIWPRSVPIHSGSRVHAIAVASMATVTTTASPTSTTHTPMPTSLLSKWLQLGGQRKYAVAPAATTAAAHSERHYTMATAATPAAASTAAASAATHQL